MSLEFPSPADFSYAMGRPGSSHQDTEATIQASNSQMTTISKDLTGVLPTELTGDIEASTAQLDYQNQLRGITPRNRRHRRSARPRSPSPDDIYPRRNDYIDRALSRLGTGDARVETLDLDDSPDSALWNHYSYLSDLIERVNRLEKEVAILKSSAKLTSESSDTSTGASHEEKAPTGELPQEPINFLSTYAPHKPPIRTTRNCSRGTSARFHQEIVTGDAAMTQVARLQETRIQYKLEFWKTPPDHIRGNRGVKDIQDIPELITAAVPVAALDKQMNDLPAFIVTQRINEASEFTHKTVTIVSSHLTKAFQGALDYYSALNLNSDDQIELDPPYTAFYHRQEYLLNLRSSKYTDDKTRVDVDLFLDFFHKELKDELQKYTLDLAAGQISYEQLPMIFRPGDTILATGTDNLQAYICMAANRSYQLNLDVLCWSMDYDGHKFRRAVTTLSIPVFEGIREITSLPAYPIRLIPDNTANETKKMLLQRGRKYYDIRKQAYRTYNGCQYGSARKFVNARFMIDLATYRRIHPDVSRFDSGNPPDATYCGNEKYRSFDNIHQDQGLTEEQLLLLPCFVYGYFMKDKIWLKLSVDNLSPIQWNKKAFEQLVLAEKQKNLVRALVDSHTSGARSEDIIADKGNGMISLLHGPPGVGKTLTAESVAELAERPLYMVTCGDIGTEAVAVEKYLNTVFFLAGTWDAVLLLDEADVFLEERGQNDLQRNSLVSAFDEAFQSRIHVAIRFPTLDEKSRKKIWQNFIQILDEETTDMDDIKAHIGVLAKKNFNGRQIRNTMGIVKALARYQGEDLGWRHFKQVVGIAEDFTTYLRDIHGHTNEEWAGANGLR